MTKLLVVKDLKTHFHTRTGVVKAVDGTSFSVDKGETLAIVGESGSGKSVTVMSLLGLIPQPPGRIAGGTAHFDGVDLLQLKPKALRHYRGRRIGMIFQDPMTALNPYLKISTQLTEVLTQHNLASSKEARIQAIEMLEKVGIPDPAKRIDQYPHHFSGGMRQRIVIAMALIAKPDLVIADEPTTALDVTIQAQILDLLQSLQKELGMAMILITHDLGVVAGVSHDILVMYAGRPVESGTAEQVFYQKAHPYTQGLIDSIPRVDSKADELYSIPGLPPDPSRLPPGCPFAPRCRYAMEICSSSQDIPERVVGQGHLSRCHLEASP